MDCNCGTPNGCNDRCAILGGRRNRPFANAGSFPNLLPDFTFVKWVGGWTIVTLFFLFVANDVVMGPRTLGCLRCK